MLDLEKEHAQISGFIPFREGISGSFAELAQEFENKSNKVKGLGAATAQTTTAKAQSFVSSGASALKAKVKQILD